MRAHNIGDIASNQAVTAEVPWYRQILNALPGLATTYLTIKQQGELNKINLDRANRGLEAIDASDYQPGVQAGLNRSTQNTFLLIAGGIGAALVLSSLLKSGRRR